MLRGAFLLKHFLGEVHSLGARSGVESLEDSLDVLVPLKLGTDIPASAEDAHLDLVHRGVGLRRVGSERELNGVLAVKFVDGLVGNKGEQSFLCLVASIVVSNLASGFGLSERHGRRLVLVVKSETVV